MDHNLTVATHQRLPEAPQENPTGNTEPASLPRVKAAANDVRAPTSAGIAGMVRLAWRAPLVFGAILGAVSEPIVRRSSPETTTKIAHRWVRLILRIVDVDVAVKGAPPEGVGLFVSNHRSYIDILALMGCLPVAFLCKREVASWPLIGGVATRMGVVFVDRGSRESRSVTLNAVAEAVLASKRVVAFPEGTTHYGPGMGSTRPGLFRAAETREFNLFPIAIEYEDPDDAWVGDDTLLRHALWWLSKAHGRVTLSFGPPVIPQNDGAPLHTRELVEQWMRAELQRLNQRTESNHEVTVELGGRDPSLNESGTWSKR